MLSYICIYNIYNNRNQFITYLLVRYILIPAAGLHWTVTVSHNMRSRLQITLFLILIPLVRPRQWLEVCSANTSDFIQTSALYLLYMVI